MSYRRITIAVLVVISTCSPAFAQKQGEVASARTIWAIKDRATKFMEAVSELSPLPATADSDKSQRWPRQMEFSYRDPNSTAILTSKRTVVNSVTGAYLFRPELSRPSWNIKIFQDGVNLLVDPVSNSVIGFSDDIVSRAISLDKLVTPDKEISKSVALSRAGKYLELTGMETDEYQLESIKLRELKVDPSPNERRWSLVYNRYSNGVPFNRQELYVELDADKGRLLELSCRNGLELPSVNRVRIDKQKAVAVAKAYVENQGEPAENIPSVSIQIVQPDAGEISDNGENVGYDRKTVLAWMVKLPITGAGGLRQSYEVAISAATGAIIHAKRSSALVDIASAELSASQAMVVNLSQAKEIQFQLPEKVDTEKWIDCEANARHYYGSLAVVRAMSEPPTAANPLTDRPVKLRLKMANGKVLDYSFYSLSFVIADGKGNYLQTGSAFQKLMDLQK